MAAPNEECITYDCAVCHGLGIVKLYSGQSPSLKEIEISCSGIGSSKRAAAQKQ